jgi:uracil-DNA glycosylase
MIKITKKKYLAQKLLLTSIDIKNYVYGEKRFNLSSVSTKKDVEQKQNKNKIKQKVSTSTKNRTENNKDTFEFFKPQTFDIEKFEKLKKNVVKCTECQLCHSRQNIVFGEGDPKKGIMIIGEGPGEDEDKQGKPFVGKAGKLLTVMINTMGMDRKEVFITNIVKCRPPNNRDPQKEEINKCTPYLTRQIDLINPKVIITLGNFASKFIIETNTGITKLRGRIFEKDNRAVIPIYHPSYLLRYPKGRIEAWKDLQLIKRTIDNRLHS